VLRNTTLLLALVIPPAAAAARDIHVNNVTGDDRLTGLSPERGEGLTGPVKTIQRALRLADKGDRIILAANDEPYRESISLFGGRHTGDGQRLFAIIGNGAVLDGSGPIPKRAWEHYHGDVFRYQPRWPAHHLLFLDGKPAKRRPGAIARNKPPLLEPLEWDIAGQWVYFRVEPSRVVEDYALTHTLLQTGVTLYHVHDVLIDNLFIRGFRLDGVNVNDGVHGCLLDRLTCESNGRSGIFVGGASSDVLIYSTLVRDNAVAQVLRNPPAQFEIRDSEIVESGKAPVKKAAAKE
jgi:hypothetical protein